MNLSIIIPCYNEEKVIENTVKEIIRSLPSQAQIIIVDDGSTDTTRKKIIRLMNTCPGVHTVAYNENKGKGYAVHQGLNLALYKRRLILDADLSVHVKYVLQFMRGATIRDCVVKGTRIQKVKQPLYRIFVGKCWKLLVWIKTGIYRDTQCPFTFLNLPREFYKDLKVDGFAFDVELLYKAKTQGYPIIDIYVGYYNTKDSKVTIRKTIETFQDLIRLDSS